MGGGWAAVWLLLALTTSSRAEGQGEEERWSRQATAERRQGDWVPLSCANCRPLDQSPQGSDSLPSVLTPPPRADDARLLPPPPPAPDGLLQQAATGLLQAYNQHQRKPHQQFLTETTAQSISRPQAQFINSPQQKPFVPEPSLEFQPPQQSNRQPQQFQFNQQQFPESNPYLNQPFLLGPQFLSAPFFPPPSFPQNVQPINPTPIQPLAPISPVSFPLNKENYQLLPDGPSFVQQITAGSKIPPSAPHQETHQHQQSLQGVSQSNKPQQEVLQPDLSHLKYSVNQTDGDKNQGEGDEVQLLYVPVETLNQRARNLGRQQSLNGNQQVTASQQQATRVENNKFSSPGKDHEYSTRKPHIEDQESFNTQTHPSKHHYNTQQNSQFQQQQLPADQEKFNSQTHSVRQQFVKQDSQFQLPAFESPQSIKQDAHATKEQYNFKQISQQTPVDQGNLNSQFQTQQSESFQQHNPLDSTGNFQINSQNVNNQYNNQFPQHSPQNQINIQGLRVDQQYTTQHSINNLQQQLPPLEQSNINFHNQQDFRTNINTQVPQLQLHQPTESALKEQPYVNQPIILDQQSGVQQLQTHQSLPQQQEFSFPETSQQTVSSVTPTRAPDVYTTQQSKRQRFRNSQHNTQIRDSTRNVQHAQNSQTLRKFPQNYQQSFDVSSNRPIESTTVGVTTHNSNPRQSWHSQQYSNSQRDNQEYHDKQEISNFQSDYFQVSDTPSPPTSSLPPPQTTQAPNQPPLSVYMETNGDSMINDVLRLLKNAKTIQVLDTVGPDSPQVFVGPSNLKAPTGYIKFELPYLNSLENNRVERKVDKLPFFVAPLNFNPPPGYSKIPFPAPHVGSVVVSNVTVLQTVLHDKNYGHEPVTISSSERYLDQYTLPAEISPISPQLPSLINSLQDDIYSVSSTTTVPTTLPDTTTHQYRSRGPNRGSQRGSLDYQTSPSPTRRPHSRTRRPWDGRPYSRRQPVTTPTTTLEPSTEVPVQQFTPQPEQLSFDSESYHVQNTATPIHIQPENNQQKVENSGTYYNIHSVGNNYNQGHIETNPQQAEQPAPPIKTQNIQQVITSSDNQNIQQYYENPEITQETYVQDTAHTTVLPTVTSPSVQQEEYTYKSQRTSGSRREPNRHHQRFRGRQRLTTSTTTESYEEQTPQIENKYNQQVDTQVSYQNIPSRTRVRNHNQQRLVENTHFQANVPVNRYNIQTERADIGLQTTERLLPSHNEEQVTQQNFNKDEYDPSLGFGHDAHQPNSQGLQLSTYQGEQNIQFPQPQVQLSQSNINVSQHQNDFINVQFPQENNQAQYTSDSLQGTSVNGRLNTQEPIQGNFQQYRQPTAQTPLQVQQHVFDQHAQQEQVAVNPQGTQTNFNNNLNSELRLNSQTNSQEQQSYFEPSSQQTQQEVQKHNNEQLSVRTVHQYTNDQLQFLPPQENFKDSSNAHFNLQGQHVSNSNNFEQVSDASPAIPQDTIVQKQELLNAKPQIGNDPEIPQNQLRLVKYNKPHSRTPVQPDSPLNEEPSRRGHHHYQSPEDNPETSSTEATTRSSLVRVRGRVRGRQRVATRNNHITTEEPNYPTTYLSRQRNSQEREETQEYIPRKRVNYPRQTYSPLRNKEVVPDQSITEKNDGISEIQSTEKYKEYSVETTTTTTTTTTTEAPTTKVMKRYQHILNRNKIRRTRPTGSPSTSGSSGTPKFLVPTTPPPITRLPSTRGRIRKPVSVKTTTSTTEYPQLKTKWNEKETFAPSAGSNEILEPLYQTRDKPQQSFGFQQTSTLQNVLYKTTPKPIVAPSTNDDDYWNQGVTIQQSTSFDFKPDFAAVTPPSFQTENKEFQGTFSPIWNGQIELQDGNYYDVFRQQQISKNVNDQTPFSSDQQKVVYQEIKSRLPIGKENQFTEKTHEVSPVETEEEYPRERIYPVYREIIKPAETIQDETSQVYSEVYEGEGKSVHEKDTYSDKYNEKTPLDEEGKNTEEESESKEGPIKRKIFATQPGKKGGRRRGSWVRVRVRKPQDMFETAESQNLASLSENAIPAVTKTTPSTLDLTLEPSTEAAPTSSPTPSEPSETINFEDALKDMLKDFITSNEDEKEEVNTDGTAETFSETKNITVASEELKTNEDKEEATEEENHLEDEESPAEITESSKNENEDEVDAVKTMVPELTSESITQQPTTILQTAENIETTIEPDFTTVIDEKGYKSPPARILGTSTTTEISLETEICYRGRCVKTKKVDSDSDLLSME